MIEKNQIDTQLTSAETLNSTHASSTFGANGHAGVAEKKQTVLRTDHLKAFYLLEVQGTQKTVKAVNDVDMQIYENEIYGIAGESGCGKTTLLKTLFNDIVPPLRLIEGKIYYRINDKDVDVTTLKPEEKRKLRMEYISYIPQGSMSVFNPVLKLKGTYEDFISSHLSGRSKDEIFELAHKQIVELGLPKNILDVYPHQLSGGMRQRVTIALAALLSPRIMIGDEPTTALDVVVQRGVIQMLKEIQNKLKNTIILVTHDMGVHANVADRIGIMYAGKIVEEATTEQIFEKPAHPYTQFLINSLPKFGDKTERDSVPGSPPSLAALPTGCPFHPRCPHVMDICRQKMPGFTQVDKTHKVACWLVGEGSNGQPA
jgi:peptide/nickel transport system ATP-binding protein